MISPVAIFTLDMLDYAKITISGNYLTKNRHYFVKKIVMNYVMSSGERKILLGFNKRINKDLI